MGLSRRAYARHRGVSDMAVRKAIASGRIAVEEDGTIDPEKADRAWGSSSDPAQVRPWPNRRRRRAARRVRRRWRRSKPCVKRCARAASPHPPPAT